MKISVTIEYDPNNKNEVKDVKQAEMQQVLSVHSPSAKKELQYGTNIPSFVKRFSADIDPTKTNKLGRLLRMLREMT